MKMENFYNFYKIITACWSEICFSFLLFFFLIAKMVTTTVQLHSTKSEPRFWAVSNPACGMSEIWDGENLWQWTWLGIVHKRLLFANHSVKTIHHHHHVSDIKEDIITVFFFKKIDLYLIIHLCIFGQSVLTMVVRWLLS